MSRTGGRFEAKTPFTDGRIVIAPNDFQLYSGASSFTRIGSGQATQHIAASQTDVLIANISKLLFKTGQTPFLQQQFGTAAGVAGPTGVANTSDPDAQLGPPPLTGAVTITPQTGFLPKGIKFVSLILKYLISTTGPLTLHTVGITKTVFANNVAPVVTNILANAANGLATVVQAQPYVTTIALATPVFQVSVLADYLIELDVTTPAATTYDLFSAELLVNYNWN